MPESLARTMRMTATTRWRSFRRGPDCARHLVVATYPGMSVTLCGLHIATRHALPEEHAHLGVRCASCERRLEPGGPHLLTPANFERIAEAELATEWEIYEGDMDAYIRYFIRRTLHRWETLLATLTKEDTQA